MFDKETLNRLYRYCLSLAHAPDEAYDLVQTSMERYLDAQQRRAGAELEPPPVGYLFAIARNAFIDRQRRQQRFPREPLDDAAPPMVSGAAALDDLVLDRRTAVTLMAELTSDDRELLYLWAVEGYTMEEIADHMEKPRGTLLSRLHRLRQRIQRAIAPAVIADPLKEVC